jgi:GNAT superfamily N-acetyltransferase
MRANETLIRLAHPGDAEAIAKIHVDSWRAVYSRILPSSYLNRLNYGRIEKSISNGLLDPDLLCLVVEEREGNAVGYVCGGPERTNNDIYESEVYELYVAPGSQRHGFGRRLLSAIAHNLYQRDFYSLIVWILTVNPNRRFYEKSGGIYLDAEFIEFAGTKLQATAYGWIDITTAFFDDQQH